MLTCFRCNRLNVVIDHIYKLSCILICFQITLFKVNNSNYIRYEAPIPGELVTGSSIEVVFIPQEPWNQIVLSLYDDSGSNNVLHTSFRSDLDLIHFNSIVSGQWADMKHANGVEIKSGSAAKLTVEILTDTLKVSVNGKEKYNYQAVLSPSVARKIRFFAALGSNCLLKSICFKDL
ncbi:galectin-4-like [Ruditapes philippinarum]|uniref:galectin-4-like n=1 Tax=Ruditapes philippinarum TaxID=129788 RepID=UPI00295C32A0|nr:galectin-4-like [Ruditapes philippinarum]